MNVKVMLLQAPCPGPGHPKWKVDQLPDGTVRWTTPSGRTPTTEPTRYPV